MTGKSENRLGKTGVKVVRKRLADGTTRQYRYGVADQAPSTTTPFISIIIRAYEASPEYARLAASSKNNARRNHAIIEAALGWLVSEDFNSKRVRSKFYALRDSLADKPATSMLVISRLTALLSWAEKRAFIDHNWAKGIEPLYSGGHREELVWTPEMQSAFLEQCDRPDIAIMFQFCAMTAMRVGDMLALKWANFDGRWVHYRPEKTHRKDPFLTVGLPVFVLPPALQLLEAIPPGAPDDLIFKVQTRSKMDKHAHILRMHFGRIKARIGAEHLHWHDLRGTAISNLFAAGCSDAEVASISGHKIGGRSMLGAYAARSDELALNAFRKLAAYLDRGPNVVPFPTRSIAI